MDGLLERHWEAWLGDLAAWGGRSGGKKGGREEVHSEGQDCRALKEAAVSFLASSWAGALHILGTARGLFVTVAS